LFHAENKAWPFLGSGFKVEHDKNFDILSKKLGSQNPSNEFRLIDSEIFEEVKNDT
jgi:hypothetical protein